MSRRLAQSEKTEIAATMFYIAYVSNILATLFGMCALATGISAAALNNWTHLTGINTKGLFKVCFQNASSCRSLESVGNVDGWLYAVRAFFITMVILGGVGVIFDVASFTKKKVHKLGVISGGLYFIAGISGIVACAMYNGNTDDVIPGYYYGIGLALAWVSCWSFFFAGIFQGVSGGMTDNSSNYHVNR